MVGHHSKGHASVPAKNTSPASPTLETLLGRAIDALPDPARRDDQAVVIQALSALSDDEKIAMLERVARGIVPGVRASRLSKVTKKVAPNPNNRPTGHSAHVLSVNGTWNRFLRETIPDGRGNRKYVADATIQDIRRMAGERRDQGDRLYQEADRWDRIGNTLAASGKATVGQLPPQQI